MKKLLAVIFAMTIMLTFSGCDDDNVFEEARAFMFGGGDDTTSYSYGNYNDYNNYTSSYNYKDYEDFVTSNSYGDYTTSNSYNDYDYTTSTSYYDDTVSDSYYGYTTSDSYYDYTTSDSYYNDYTTSTYSAATASWRTKLNEFETLLDSYVVAYNNGEDLTSYDIQVQTSINEILTIKDSLPADEQLEFATEYLRIATEFTDALGLDINELLGSAE